MAEQYAISNRRVNDQALHAEPARQYRYVMDNGIQTMGMRIKLLRQAKGLTQSELGDLCGVGKSAVSSWESDDVANIKLQTFLLLCEALGTKYEYLVFGAERRAPNGDSRPLSSLARRGRFPA